MADLTDEQREAARAILTEAIASAIACDMPEPWEIADHFASKSLDALIAQGWGPVAEAEARGYRAGVEAAVRVCRMAAAEALSGQVQPGQPRRVVTRPMARMAIRCAQRVRALTPEKPHG